MNYETLKLTILQEKYKIQDKIDEIVFYVKIGVLTIAQASELVDLARAHGLVENEVAPDAATAENMQALAQSMLEEMQEMKSEIGTLKAAAIQGEVPATEPETSGTETTDQETGTNEPDKAEE